MRNLNTALNLAHSRLINAITDLISYIIIIYTIRNSYACQDLLCMKSEVSFCLPLCAVVYEYVCDVAEMDEEDCERRRMECLDEMSNLEKQFMDLKDQ